jgi:hypothetical protein
MLALCAVAAGLVLSPAALAPQRTAALAGAYFCPSGIGAATSALSLAIAHERWRALASSCALLSNTSLTCTTGAMPVAQPSWVRCAALSMQQDETPEEPADDSKAKAGDTTSKPTGKGAETLPPTGFEWGLTF